MLVVTGEVVTVNVAALASAGMVTLAGTVATELLLLSATTAPAEGAGPFRAIVAIDELPPTTKVGLRVSEATWGALATVKVMRKSSGLALPV